MKYNKNSKRFYYLPYASYLKFDRRSLPDNLVEESHVLAQLELGPALASQVDVNYLD